MKILHVIYDDVKNPWVGGGGALRALEINRLLAQKNNTISMITGNFPGARSGRIENMHFERIGFGKYYLLSRLSFAILLPFYLRKYDFDIVVNEFSVFSPVYCHWYTNKPVVHTFYHRIGIQAFKKFLILGAFAYIFEKIFLATARSIITISPSVTKEIENKKPGSNRDRRIECIYTGVDRELFKVKPLEGEYIAFIGRLDVYMKGIDILLEAFNKLSDTSIELRIAGSGPKKSRLTIEKYLRKFEIEDRVNMLGRISDSEKKDFLAKALFCVMPSRYEGWGIAAIEAASCAKPVIGTKISGLQDAIIDGKTGILVEPENSDALVAAMEKLLSDKDLRLKMGDSGREWARNFEWESIAEKQYEFYEEVCAM